VRRLSRVLGHRRLLLAGVALAVLLVLAGAGVARGDVYGNIAPASQLPSSGIVGRYPLANYQLDQYFPGISVGLFSGVSVSGVPPLIAYFIANVIWLLTAFLANALITVFAFAFSLNLIGNGTPGSGALAPISEAIHTLYTSTLGQPWMIAAVVAAGCWAMWKALVQRRYTETAGALAVSLLYCVLAIGIVTQPSQTIAPASQLSNELSTSLLSLTAHGDLGGEQEAKSAAANQLFGLLVLNPWTVLEFGGIEHCTTNNGKTSVQVRPLSSDAVQESSLASQLETEDEVQAADGKRCINNRNKYAPQFLAYATGSSGRNAEHNALEHGSDSDLSSSDPAKTNGSYPLGPADEPAAESMGKGGQYERLLLAVVILAGESGGFLSLGALSLGIILASLELLLMLGFAPAALLIGIFPGRGHAFFRAWLAKLAGYLARKVIYALILAVILAICQALDDATSNLGWLLTFALQAAFLWSVFLQRKKLTNDLLHATAGPEAARDGASRLQALFLAAGLARMAGMHRNTPPVATANGGRPKPKGAPPQPSAAAPSTPPPAPPAPPQQVLTPARPQPALGAGDTPNQESPK
jgi:TrbL/VirB6 plasmid conjugal transfer protein